MSRRRRAGRLFWLWTFAIGIYSPHKGQRRIAADRVADRERLAELESENNRLKAANDLLMGDNERLVALRNDLENRLAMADGINEMNKVKAAASGAPTTPPKAAPTWAATEPANVYPDLRASSTGVTY